jgi:uncharacterized caspase-like protein
MWNCVMRTVGFVFAVWLIALFSQPALAGKRVALVMGNSAYQNVNPLTNPANDADAMAATFRGAGFDVVELKRDLKANEMRRALREFSDHVRDADIAVVYFAGHGIEIDGTNYLIPVDAVLERDIDAYDEAVALDRILTVIEPAKQLRLVILDACRDNPFGKSMKRALASRAVGRGLAKVEPTSPNTLVAYAAKAGSTASDGDSRNSPFTSALVRYLPRPGLDLRKAFGFVRDDVLKVTANKQEPFIYGSLGGDDVALVPASAAPSLAGGAADPNAAIRQDYELAERIGTQPVWDSFIRKYPSGFYTDLAKAQRDRSGAEAAGAASTEKPKVATAEQRLAIEAAKGAGQNDAADDKTTAPQAMLTPPDQAGGAPAKPDQPSSSDLPRLLQTELRRVGCNTGAIDGNWNAAAQESLGRFNKSAWTNFDVKLASIDALDAVRSKPARVCPLRCERGYKADGDSCARIICKAGYEINNDKDCERTEAKKREKPVAKLTLPTEPKPNAPRTGLAKPERATTGGCSSISARCAVQIGGRCSNGHWEYAQHGAGGDTLAFNTCIGSKLAGSRR